MSKSNTDRDVGQSDNEAHGFNTEFLDDTSDTHAFWFGIMDGLRGISPKPTRKESVKEPHYYTFGYFVGWIGKIVLVGYLGIELGVVEQLGTVF